MSEDVPRDPWSGKPHSAEQRVTDLAERIPRVHQGDGQLDARVAEWAAGAGSGAPTNLLLVGPVGVGKSWSAWHASLAAVRVGILGAIAIVTADEFRERTAPQDHGQHFREVGKMAEADLLVLDDIGALRTSDWSREQLHAVIDRRYNAMRPTVVTTNLPKLGDEVGDRIASRLAADIVIVTLAGPDRRRQRDGTAGGDQRPPT
jgi:DNA replication protein DnaC